MKAWKKKKKKKKKKGRVASIRTLTFAIPVQGSKN